MKPLTDRHGVTAEMFMFREFNSRYGRMDCPSCHSGERWHIPLLWRDLWWATCTTVEQNFETVVEKPCALPLDVIQSSYGTGNHHSGSQLDPGSARGRADGGSAS